MILFLMVLLWIRVIEMVLLILKEFLLMRNNLLIKLDVEVCEVKFKVIVKIFVVFKNILSLKLVFLRLVIIKIRKIK